MCDVAFRVRTLRSARVRSRSSVMMCAPVEVHSLNEYASGVPDTHFPRSPYRTNLPTAKIPVAEVMGREMLPIVRSGPRFCHLLPNAVQWLDSGYHGRIAATS